MMRVLSMVPFASTAELEQTMLGGQECGNVGNTLTERRRYLIIEKRILKGSWPSRFSFLQTRQSFTACPSGL